MTKTLLITLNFLLSFNTAQAESTVVVPMSYTAETCIPANLLWEQFKASMIDSKKTWLWPTPLSEVNGTGIQSDAQIDVLYKLPFMDQLYSYRLSEIEEGMQFRYSAIQGKHPFVGGALIRITEIESKRQLTWKGEYETQSNQWFSRLFFKAYAKKFFKTLGQNIKSAEKNFCNQQTED